VASFQHMVARTTTFLWRHSTNLMTIEMISFLLATTQIIDMLLRD
jgi:hypothetical protein